MNPQDDDTNTRTGLWVVFTTVAVLLVSLIIWVLKGAGPDSQPAATLVHTGADATASAAAHPHGQGSDTHQAADADQAGHVAHNDATHAHTGDTTPAADSANRSDAAARTARQAAAHATAAATAAASATGAAAQQAANAALSAAAQADAAADQALAAGGTEALDAAQSARQAAAAARAAADAARNAANDVATAVTPEEDTQFVAFDNLDQGELAAVVHFASASATLPSDAGAEVAGVVDAIKASPSRRVLLAGFHDPTGNAAFNADLARKRAFSVRDALISQGIPADRIILRKPEQTTGSGTNAEARRVELRLLD